MAGNRIQCAHAPCSWVSSNAVRPSYYSLTQKRRAVRFLQLLFPFLLMAATSSLEGQAQQKDSISNTKRILLRRSVTSDVAFDGAFLVDAIEERLSAPPVNAVASFVSGPSLSVQEDLRTTLKSNGRALNGANSQSPWKLNPAAFDLIIELDHYYYERAKSIPGEALNLSVTEKWTAYESRNASTAKSWQCEYEVSGPEAKSVLSAEIASPVAERAVYRIVGERTRIFADLSRHFLPSEADRQISAAIKFLEEGLIGNGQRNAISALGALGELARSAGPRLQQLFNDANTETRVHAAISYAKVNPTDLRSAIDVLAVGIEDPKARWSAARGLRELGTAAAPAVPAISRTLAKGDWSDHDDTISKLVDSLIEIGRPAKPALEEHLKSGRAVRRLYVAEALIRIGNPAVELVLPPLIETIRELESSIVNDSRLVLAIELVGSLGPSARHALPSLNAATKHPFARNAARAAIRRVKSKE